MGPAFSYGKNYFLGETDDDQIFVDSLDAPSLTPNHADSIYSYHFDSGSGYAGHLFFHWRHGKTGVTNFIDGHAKPETKASFNYDKYQLYLK